MGQMSNVWIDLKGGVMVWNIEAPIRRKKVVVTYRVYYPMAPRQSHRFAYYCDCLGTMGEYPG